MNSEAAHGALVRISALLEGMTPTDPEYEEMLKMHAELTELVATLPLKDAETEEARRKQVIVSAREHLQKVEADLLKAEAERQRLVDRLDPLLLRAESEEGDDVALEKVQELYDRLQVQDKVVNEISAAQREAITLLQEALEDQ